MLLVTNSDVFSLFFPIPSLDVYIHFTLPLSNPSLFHEEFPLCLDIGALYYFAFILYYECSCRKPRGWRGVGHGFEGQYGLNNYMALSEKIAEDRERKRIAREIHDTLGHALTGISAGLDAVGVLIDIDPNQARSKWKAYQKLSVKGSRCEGLSQPS